MQWCHTSLFNLLDRIAASLFENNWLSWQIVSKHKTQITLLILGRGALSIIFCCVQSLYCHLDTRHHFYPWSLVFKTIAWSRFKAFSCVLKCPIWATFEVLITFKRSHRSPNEVSILAGGRLAEYWQESSLYVLNSGEKVVISCSQKAVFLYKI